MTSRKTQTTAQTRELYLKRKNAVYLCSFIGANSAVSLSSIVSKGFCTSFLQGERLWVF